MSFPKNAIALFREKANLNNVPTRLVWYLEKRRDSLADCWSNSKFIAEYLGEDPRVVREALEQLHKTGSIERHTQRDGQRFYRALSL